MMTFWVFWGGFFDADAGIEHRLWEVFFIVIIIVMTLSSVKTTNGAWVFRLLKTNFNLTRVSGPDLSSGVNTEIPQCLTGRVTRTRVYRTFGCLSPCSNASDKSASRLAEPAALSEN